MACWDVNKKMERLNELFIILILCHTMLFTFAMADQLNQNMTITSFNCKHFKDSGAKFDFINSFSKSSDLIFFTRALVV